MTDHSSEAQNVLNQREHESVGLLGSFVGPEATSTELLIQFIPAIIYTILLYYRAVRNHLVHSVAQHIILIVLAFDITGGVLTNATFACKKWYFRPGKTGRDHLLFSFIHVIHIGIVAVFFRSFDVLFFSSATFLFALSAVAVVSAPLYLKNVIAMFTVLNAFFFDLYVWGQTPCLEWFIPLLFLKICVGHLVPLATWTP